MSLASRMVIVLTSVGLISGGFLATVGIITKERIAINKQREIEKAIVAVVPGTHSSEPLLQEKDLTVYACRDEAGAVAGYAVNASGVGFQDKITFMLGTNPEITRITSLVILDQKETPGLGAKIADRESFLKFWEDKDCGQPLRLRKPAVKTAEELGPSEVNTVTGATISSETVLKTANISLERIKKLREEGQLRSTGENAR